MRRGLILLLVLSLGLNAGLLYKALSGDGDGRRRHRSERGDVSPEAFIAHRLDRVSERYGLDEAQRARMEDVLRRFVPDVMAQHRRVTEARAGVLAQLGAAVVNEDSVRVRTMELNAAQTELDSLVTESMLREVLVLTPEQRARYVEHLHLGHDRGRHSR